MMGDSDPDDPRGLIREAYRIEGIGPGDCRSIFLDWALGLASGEDVPAHIAALLARYGPAHSDHPMTEVLREGLTLGLPRGRRGGWAGRRGGRRDD